MKVLITITVVLFWHATSLASIHSNTTLSQLNIKPDESYGSVRVLLFPITHGEKKRYSVSNEWSLNSCKKGVVSTFSFETVGYGSESFLTDSATGQAIAKGYKIDFDFCRRVVRVLSSTQVDGMEFSLSNSMDFLVAVPNGMMTRIKGPGILHNNPYPGSFRFQAVRNSSGKVVNARLVNYVSIEDYVKGVIPNEMGEEFSDEARKTQAVASRTYGLRDMLIARCDPNYAGRNCYPQEFDVRPTTQDQVYVGTARQTDRSNNAVDDTRGLVSAKYDKSRGGFILIKAEFSPSGQGARMSQRNAGALSDRRVKFDRILAIEYPGSVLKNVLEVFAEKLDLRAENGFVASISSASTNLFN